MTIRWMAALYGFFADFLISQVIMLAMVMLGVVRADAQLDLSRPADIAVMVLLLLSTGVGGFVAGRIAGVSYWLNGMLVGILGIFFNTIFSLGEPVAIIFIFTQVLGCAMGAIGGFLSGLYRT